MLEALLLVDSKVTMLSLFVHSFYLHSQFCSKWEKYATTGITVLVGIRSLSKLLKLFSLILCSFEKNVLSDVYKISNYDYNVKRKRNFLTLYNICLMLYANQRKKKYKKTKKTERNRHSSGGVSTDRVRVSEKKYSCVPALKK